MEPELLWRNISDVDVPATLGRFDAVVESLYNSDGTLNERRQTASSWYADGTLHVRGFFFIKSDGQTNYLLLSTRPTSPVVGYGYDEGRLDRFEQDPVGPYAFESAICDRAVQQPVGSASLYENYVYLPQASPDATPESIRSYIVPRARSLAQATAVPPGCRLLTSVPVRAESDTVDALLARSAPKDADMLFFMHRQAAFTEVEARRLSRVP
jgi:hypothetical protein